MSHSKMEGMSGRSAYTAPMCGGMGQIVQKLYRKARGRGRQGGRGALESDSVAAYSACTQTK